MKKIVRLSESDLSRIVKKIIKENKINESKSEWEPAIRKIFKKHIKGTKFEDLVQSIPWKNSPGLELNFEDEDDTQVEKFAKEFENMAIKKGWNYQWDGPYKLLIYESMDEAKNTQIKANSSLMDKTGLDGHFEYEKLDGLGTSYDVYYVTPKGNSKLVKDNLATDPTKWINGYLKMISQPGEAYRVKKLKKESVNEAKMPKELTAKVSSKLAEYEDEYRVVKRQYEEMKDLRAKLPIVLSEVISQVEETIALTDAKILRWDIRDIGTPYGHQLDLLVQLDMDSKEVENQIGRHMDWTIDPISNQDTQKTKKGKIGYAFWRTLNNGNELWMVVKFDGLGNYRID